MNNKLRITKIDKSEILKSNRPGNKMLHPDTIDVRQQSNQISK